MDVNISTSIQVKQSDPPLFSKQIYSHVPMIVNQSLNIFTFRNSLNSSAKGSLTCGGLYCEIDLDLELCKKHQSQSSVAFGTIVQIDFEKVLFEEDSQYEVVLPIHAYAPSSWYYQCQSPLVLESIHGFINQPTAQLRLVHQIEESKDCPLYCA